MGLAFHIIFNEGQKHFRPKKKKGNISRVEETFKLMNKDYLRKMSWYFLHLYKHAP